MSLALRPGGTAIPQAAPGPGKGFVPSLLQTPDCAWTLVSCNADWDEPGEFERFVEAKVARKGR